MCVLLYAGEGHDASLGRLVRTLVKEDAFEMVKGVNALCRRFHSSSTKPDVAVLYAATKRDLLEILSIRELLSGLRIILILPDGESETVAAGHKLRPRYLGYADDDLEETAAVLRRMLV